jgi:DNA mismatch repair protein MutS
MPPSLLQRAEEILQQLEDKHVGSPIEESLKKITAPKMQLSIFDAHTETFHRIRQLLEDMDINRLTPVEALLKLQEIKNELK